MKSRKYCPECKSFNIKRNHRSLIQKYLFLVSSLYQCEHCNLEFTDKKMSENTLEDAGKFDIPVEDEKKEGAGY